MSAETAAAAAPSQPSAVARVLAPVRVPLLGAGLLAAAGAMLTLVPLAQIAQVLRQAWEHGGGTPMPWLSLLCLLAGALLLVLAELLAHWADQRLTHGLRLAMVRRLAQVPLGWFNSHASGEVKQVMQDDVAMLHSLVAHFYTAVGRAGGAIAVAVLYLLAMDWRLALVALLPFPAFVLFLRRAAQASGAPMQELMERMGQLNSAVVEFVNGMPVVKAFAGEARSPANYREAVDGWAGAFARMTRPLVASMANAHALIAPVTVLGVVLAGAAVFCSLGWMQPVDALPFVLVAPAICAPLLLLHALLHDLQAATGAAQRVLALLQTPVLAQPDEAGRHQPVGHGLRFEQVGYAYDAEQPALADISFEVPAGTVTAVVGASGAGKSTLARLLLRFADPTAGRILLGGADVRAIESRQLYQHIGFVLQQVQLVHASVRDNIALGRPAASLAEVQAAAQAAQIHERILALPRGYDSVVGEDAQLSGGEMQRVSLARAVLLDAPVLVLDEATAALDAESEAAIQTALARFAMGRTVLVIAHRLDTLMHADQILVLDQGRLVEQGRHEQLLAQQGRYARLWRLGGYEASGQKAGLPC